MRVKEDSGTAALRIKFGHLAHELGIAKIHIDLYEQLQLQRLHFQREFVQALDFWERTLSAHLLTALIGLCRVYDDYQAPKSWEFSVDDFADLPSLASKLRQTKRLVDKWLAGQLSAGTKVVLANYHGSSSDQAPLQEALLQDLNATIRGSLGHNARFFAGVALRSQTLDLLSMNLQGGALLRLNRLLFEDAYPLELSRKRKGHPEREAFHLLGLVREIRELSGPGLSRAKRKQLYEDLRFLNGGKRGERKGGQPVDKLRRWRNHVICHRNQTLVLQGREDFLKQGSLELEDLKELVQRGSQTYARWAEHCGFNCRVLELGGIGEQVSSVLESVRLGSVSMRAGGLGRT
jgi:hypothetical protein